MNVCIAVVLERVTICKFGRFGELSCVNGPNM